MISLWITFGLVIAAFCVSTLGAYFSILGLGALFSGAMIAVWAMAGSLEFAKFVLAAYLHQTWKNLNRLYRFYLVFSVVVLSIITSMGVFGFLSDAYQSASLGYESANIKIENLNNQQKNITAEIARLNRSVDEIPASRVSRRLKLRAELEPVILELNKKYDASEKELAEAKLKILDVKKQVGPLIYIAKSFNMDIDLVVRYLILIFVSVFDPLAICLVIASTHAIESRRNAHLYQKKEVVKEDVKPEAQPVAEVIQPEPTPEVAPVVAAVAAQPEPEPESDDVIVQMNFKDESEDKKAV